MVFAFHVAKGGVGKTSLSGNCSYLASQSKKTVLVDGDPQGNATSWLVEDRYQNELAELLMGDGEVPLSDCLVEVEPGFFLLPSRIGGKLKLYGETKLFQEPHAFDDLNEILYDAGFELIIYDLGPGLGNLERCVISSVDEVIMPVMGEYFSLDGIEIATKEIDRINRAYRKEVLCRRLVVNALNRSYRRHVETYRQYQRLNFELFTVAQDAKIAEAQFYHLPLPAYWPKAKALPELERLTDAIIGG